MSELEDQLVKQISLVGFPPPTREHRFWPGRRFRFDLSWPELMIACEVEGGTWVNGAHGRGKHFESDCVKYNNAALLGWLVIRVTTDMVKDGRALEYVERALQTRRAPRPLEGET